MYSKEYIDSCTTKKEDEAEIIRRIYNEYLSGKGSYAIARDLTRDNIPTIRTAEKWHDGVVKGILQNPIYNWINLIKKNHLKSVKSCLRYNIKYIGLKKMRTFHHKSWRI